MKEKSAALEWLNAVSLAGLAYLLYVNAINPCF